ncbi:MAG: hypothetical protein K0S65_3622, partial [Labilithrix sp.]|nr:hypothetical protein [Labilithrix sp.]
VNDMARVPDASGREHYVMVKAPGIVYAGVPAYALFSKVIAPLFGRHYPAGPGLPTMDETALEEQRLWWIRASTWAMRLSASQLPCFLFLVWLERYLRAFSEDVVLRCIAVAAAGLGTNYLAYTHIFASHSQYAAIAFLAFALIESELRRSRGEAARTRPRRALMAGFLTSACVTLEYPSLFMTLVLVLFAACVFWSPRQAIASLVSRARYLVSPGAAPRLPGVTPTRAFAFGLGGLLNVPHMMWFHYCAYGNAFTPGHKQLETAQFAADHRTGLWGISWPPWSRIQTLAIDPGFGFFGMSPFMWLGLLSVPVVLLVPGGAPAQRRHWRILTIVWFACMAIVFAVNAGFAEWRAGWTVGPRYLVVCAPFFAFGGLLLLERFAGDSPIRRALARGVGGGLALAGVITIGTVGLLVDTLPDTIRRPFAQFFVPMVRAGLVPHHVGEWVGIPSALVWYLLCASLLLAPIVLGLWMLRSDTRSNVALRVSAFVITTLVGLLPAVTSPADGSKLFVLHPSTVWFATEWEPAKRERAAELRDESARSYARQ